MQKTLVCAALATFAVVTAPAFADDAATPPQGAAPADAKPADAKPADAAPGDAKPADAAPGDVKPADAPDAKPDAAPKPPKPPPYSLPWQLRPVVVANVVRWDNSFARYEDAAGHAGFTWVTILNAIVKIPGTGSAPGTGLGALLRLPIAYDSPPTGPNVGASFANPVLAALYGVKLPKPFKLNVSLAFTLPIGMGGGDTPDAGQKNARAKALNARAQMDNSLFAVNDFAIIPGVDFAYVDHNLTVQVEATLFQLLRVRGCSNPNATPAVCDQREEAKTNFTAGLHVGYFVLPQVSLGLDLRYQRWFNAPLAVENTRPTAANGWATQSDAYDTLTFALGPRFHIPIGKTWLRPGFSYGRALDKPMAASTPNYHLFQVDVPFIF